MAKQQIRVALDAAGNIEAAHLWNGWHRPRNVVVDVRTGAAIGGNSCDGDADFRPLVRAARQFTREG